MHKLLKILLAGLVCLGSMAPAFADESAGVLPYTLTAENGTPVWQLSDQNLSLIHISVQLSGQLLAGDLRRLQPFCHAQQSAPVLRRAPGVPELEIQPGDLPAGGVPEKIPRAEILQHRCLSGAPMILPLKGIGPGCQCRHHLPGLLPGSRADALPQRHSRALTMCIRDSP